MILDSSAIVSIAMQEDDASALAQAIGSADRIYVSAVTVVEASIVLLRKSREDATQLVACLIDGFNAQIVAVDTDQSSLAVEAFQMYGKGRHRASLNFGDCFSYALAKHLDRPLLFKGNDFAKTDIKIARY